MGKMKNKPGFETNVGKRKAARKASRQAKKQRKSNYYNGKKELEVVIKNKTNVVGNVVGLKPKPPKVKVSRKEEKKSIKWSTQLPSLQEDKEIEALEAKLGIGSGKSKKNKVLQNKRLKSELTKDGIDPEFIDFLDSLGKDSDENSVGDRKSSGEVSEIEEQGSDLDQENDSEEERPASPQANSNTVFMPKNNLYGKETKIIYDRSKSRLFRGNREVSENKLEVSDLQINLRRRINGLLNRLTEENINPICMQAVTLYKNNSRNDVNEAMFSVISSVFSSQNQVLTKISMVFAALITALSIKIAPEISTALMEKLVVAATGSKASDQVFKENVASLLCFLYLFGVVSVKMPISLCLYLVESNGTDKEIKMLTKEAVKIISIVTNLVGAKIRQDSPGQLKMLIETIQNCASQDSGDTKGYREHLLDEIFILKNNRAKSAKSSSVPKFNSHESTKRLKSWLKKIQAEDSTSKTMAAFDIGFEDLKQASELGRWWIVGSSWLGKASSLNNSHAVEITANPNDLNVTSMPRKSGGWRHLIATAISNASPGMIVKSKKLGMNTDIRKAIFISIFSGEDSLGAFRKLLGLKLGEVQQREMVHVILRCCESSKTYNPFFAALLKRLCDHSQRFRFTTQLSFWDSFKRIDSSADVSNRKVSNLSKLFASLILDSTLSLSVLKAVEFEEIGKSENQALVMFFNVFFYEILLSGWEESDPNAGLKQLLKTFRRLSQSKDFELVADGIRFFFAHLMVSNFEQPIAKEFNRRKRKVFKLLDAVDLQLKELAEDNEVVSTESEYESDTESVLN